MTYDGGKGGAGVYQAIINLMPPHRRYIEAFLGSGAVIRHKRPAEHNIAIEKDNLVVSSFLSMPDVRAVQRPITDLGLARHRGSVIVINDDAISTLPLLQLGKGDLVYCDPPYVMSTRSSQRPIYRHELDDTGHARLVKVLHELRRRQVMVMISGYDCDLYNICYAGWRRARPGDGVRD